MSAGTIFFARHEGLVILKLAGTIRYGVLRDTCQTTAAFQAFLERLFQQADFENILIDLSETVAIDSTNLGLLARIAQFMLGRWQRKPTILSTNEDINAVLESVGFDQVFHILHQFEPSAAALEAVPPAPAPGDQSRLLLEAHRALSALNEKNKRLFRNVVQMLEEEQNDRRL